VTGAPIGPLIDPPKDLLNVPPDVVPSVPLNGLLNAFPIVLLTARATVPATARAIVTRSGATTVTWSGWMTATGIGVRTGPRIGRWIGRSTAALTAGVIDQRSATGNDRNVLWIVVLIGWMTAGRTAGPIVLANGIEAASGFPSVWIGPSMAGTPGIIGIQGVETVGRIGRLSVLLNVLRTGRRMGGTGRAGVVRGIRGVGIRGAATAVAVGISGIIVNSGPTGVEVVVAGIVRNRVVGEEATISSATRARVAVGRIRPDRSRRLLRSRWYRPNRLSTTGILRSRRRALDFFGPPRRTLRRSRAMCS
jgi:hypothetical protein